MRKTILTRIAPVAIIVFIASIFFQRWLEVTNRSDSAGLWYTMICSIIYTLIVLFFLMITILVFRFIVAKKARKGGP